MEPTNTPLEPLEIVAYAAPVIMPNGVIIWKRFTVWEDAVKACRLFEEEQRKHESANP